MFLVNPAYRKQVRFFNRYNPTNSIIVSIVSNNYDTDVILIHSQYYSITVPMVLAAKVSADSCCVIAQSRWYFLRLGRTWSVARPVAAAVSALCQPHWVPLCASCAQRGTKCCYARG